MRWDRAKPLEPELRSQGPRLCQSESAAPSHPHWAGLWPQILSGLGIAPSSSGCLPHPSPSADRPRVHQDSRSGAPRPASPPTPHSEGRHPAPRGLSLGPVGRTLREPASAARPLPAPPTAGLAPPLCRRKFNPRGRRYTGVHRGTSSPGAPAAGTRPHLSGALGASLGMLRSRAPGRRGSPAHALARPGAGRPGARCASSRPGRCPEQSGPDAGQDGLPYGLR